jgi:hypothetical protein
MRGNFVGVQQDGSEEPDVMCIWSFVPFQSFVTHLAIKKQRIFLFPPPHLFSPPSQISFFIRVGGLEG